MSHKQPRSVQVVLFSETDCGREFLLLRRIASHGGFWQSVTGSLEDKETHHQAAVREVGEETGITVGVEDLIDLKLLNTFEITPQWRTRYAPGVTENEEVCFAVRIDKCAIRVDAVEHDAWAWVGYDAAMRMLHWESSKRALARFTDLFEQVSSPGALEELIPL